MPVELIDYHSDNEKSKDVLIETDLDYVKDDVKIIYDRGVIFCKDCKNEVTHFCIEDKPLVPKGPAFISLVRNKKTKNPKKYAGRCKKYIKIQKNIKT